MDCKLFKDVDLQCSHICPSLGVEEEVSWAIIEYSKRTCMIIGQEVVRKSPEAFDECTYSLGSGFVSRKEESVYLDFSLGAIQRLASSLVLAPAFDELYLLKTRWRLKINDYRAKLFRSAARQGLFQPHDLSCEEKLSIKHSRRAKLHLHRSLTRLSG